MARYVLAALADEEDRNHEERIRLRILRDASNPFLLAENKFKKLFRLPNHGAHQICEMLDDQEFNKFDRIPKHLKILAALHYYGNGSYQTADGGDSLIALSQSSMCRAIEETNEAIIKILTPIYIKFPKSLEDKRQTMREFEEMYRFPNVLGALDGTHIAIHKPPSTLMAPGIIFYNRKGFYSINCQVVTDAKGKIISINPNFPGSTHDSAVWQASALAHHLEREFLQGMEDQWLLGDKGYQLLPWLMTPVANPETEAEHNYNVHHAAARNIVEITFGKLKNKFRCLHKHRTMHYKPIKSAKITIVCCTLYNMFHDMLSGNDDDDDSMPNDDDEDDVIDTPATDVGHDYLQMARTKRNMLINLFR